jgi:hypothetical protein
MSLLPAKRRDGSSRLHGRNFLYDPARAATIQLTEGGRSDVGEEAGRVQ